MTKQNNELIFALFEVYTDLILKTSGTNGNIELFNMISASIESAQSKVEGLNILQEHRNYLEQQAINNLDNYQPLYNESVQEEEQARTIPSRIMINGVELSTVVEELNQEGVVAPIVEEVDAAAKAQQMLLELEQSKRAQTEVNPQALAAQQLLNSMSQERAQATQPQQEMSAQERAQALFSN